MRLSRKLLLSLLSLLGCFCLLGCGLADVGSSGKVIYANHNGDDTFAMQLKNMFEEKAKAAGIDVEFLDAKGDSNLQIDQLNEAIDDKAAAIVLLAMDGTSIVPSVEKAREAGIPIVIMNRDVNDPKVIGALSDDREAGRMQGEFMAKNLPPNAKIVYLMGESSLGAAIKRWEGFKETCLDKRPDIQLLASVDGSWSKAEGMKAMTLWLSFFPEINGVVAGNDEMALGAIQALKAANRLEGCLVTGVDATPAGLAAVRAGELSQTIRQDAEGQAAGAVTLVKAFLDGKPPTESLDIPFTSITQENIAQFSK
ncbi:sugar ABC transporter substrate-binding protein [Selenomonas sp. TAMA-11512]|uniref:sugar ABC transporter substrate-binding protein n=1 Tax=Selenomonas sp. TAMA-11512 TaxID=3095337 RepID=UPI00308D2CC9|nr:sugar ABC transporter substrate-binding protein [Selenomonas sp. TAMA-11512]